jgi:hypothetical protein
MKKNRLIFYAVFGAFHLFLVFFTFYVESNKNDFAFLTQMLKWISITKWGAMLGLILLITDMVWSYMHVRETDKERAAMAHEINTLKAKLFDLQEAAKPVDPPQSRPGTQGIKS